MPKMEDENDEILVEIFDSLSDEARDFNSLKEKALKLLAEVNYLLTKAEKVNVIVIIPPNSDKISILEALANKNSEEFSSQYELNIHLPKGFKINDKIFWECSNKIKSNITDKESILQVLVNIFFIKNLIEISDRLGFIVVVPEKATINETSNNFISIIENFISIFPNEERINLKENVIFVVTQFNENTKNLFLKTLQEKKVILEYFPKLSENLKYLHELEDISIGEKKINIKQLSSFLKMDQGTRKQNSELVQALYDDINSNISKIYKTIKSFFTEENFNIYESRDCSNFYKAYQYRYNKYVQPFFLQSNHLILEKSPSYFQGLQQLFEFKEILDKQNNNALSTGLKILGVIIKFLNDKEKQDKMQDYYYVLDQQIKELLLFQKALSSNASYELTICKSFIQENYLPSIKNIKPQDKQSIEYYREAIKWLNRYDKSADIAKTKSTCYYKIADILNYEENAEEALANYHYALKYNENSKEIYNKMADILCNKLGKKLTAAEFYKIHNKFFYILRCFENASNDNPKDVIPYLKKGDYLRSQGQSEEAANAYGSAMSLEPKICEQWDILYKIINTLEEESRSEKNPEIISLSDREEYLAEIIGKYPEI